MAEIGGVAADNMDYTAPQEGLSAEEVVVVVAEGVGTFPVDAYEMVTGSYTFVVWKSSD